MSAEPLRFDARAASAYDRFMGRWSRLYVPALLAAAGVGAGQRVLDVATGTGEAALLATSALGPSGKIVGADISLPMLRAGRPRVATHSISLVAMDGQALAVRDGSFDAVICQLGLMFFPDVARGLQEFRRVLRRRGRVALSVWSTPERVPLIRILAQALNAHVPSQRDDVFRGFSLGDGRLLQESLARAGFEDVRVAGETREVAFESFDDYWGPVEDGGGRLGQIYKGLPDDARRAVIEEVRRRLRQFESNGRLVMQNEALIASGRA